MMPPLDLYAIEPDEGAITTPDHDPAYIDPRRCAHVNEDGVRCRAWRVKGERLCAGHLGRGVAANPVSYGKLSGSRRLEKAQERKRTPQDIYLQAAVDHAEEFVETRLAIIRNAHAPYGDRLRAMRDLEDRGLGRPTEHQETVTINPMDCMAELSNAELIALADRYGVLDELEAQMAEIRSELNGQEQA